MNTVTQKISELKKLIGIRLVACDDFKGVDGVYFNVVTCKPVFISEEYYKLLWAADRGFIKSVEPNGYKRLAIFY